MRYLIWGYYGYGNLGDELILEGISGELKKRDPGAVIYARCLRHPQVDDVIPFAVEGIATGGRSRWRWLSYLWKVWWFLSNVDMLIIGGGTLFLDRGRHNGSMLLLAAVVLMARVRRRKVITVGTGIDPLACPSSLGYLKYILRNCEHVRVRDGHSYFLANYLLQFDKKVVRTADIVFALPFERATNSGESKAIVLSMVDFYATMVPSEEKRDKLVQRTVELLGVLVARYPHHRVILCAFQKGIGDNDYGLFESIEHRFRDAHPDRKDRVEMTHLVDKGQVASVFGRASFVIGMRFHSLVLAAIHERPFIAIDIESKLRELCVDFSMPAVDIEEFISCGLPNEYFDAMDKTKVSSALLERIGAKAKSNFLKL